MNECGKHFLYLHRKNVEGHEYIFTPSRCKSWGCPHCRPLKAKIVAAYIKENFKGEDVRMVSLTVFHSGDPAAAWRGIGDYWNRLRTNVSKKHGKFTYIRIIEPHKDGLWPHMHILIKGPKVVYDMLDKCVSSGFGWQAHCKAVPASEAAVYVSKYLTKEWPTGDADALRVLSKTRIVCVSRDLPALFTKKSNWDLIEYGQPGKEALYRLNLLIAYCESHKSIYCLSSPFDDGFRLQTNIEIPAFKLEEILTPYIWDYTDGMNYTFAPMGIQQSLDFPPVP